METDRDAASPGTTAGFPSERSWFAHLGDLWRSDPKGMSIDLLRVGMGVVWVLNLIFILAPANQFFPTFRDTALSFAPSSLGGPGVADFVAAHAMAFAWITAVLTGYLAVAFVLGVTTRFACIVGGVASVLILATQFLSTFALPGGTDVGPHPLYLLIYLILFTGGAGKYVAVDHWIWETGRAKAPRLSRWLAAPPQMGATSRLEAGSIPIDDRNMFPFRTQTSRLRMKDQTWFNLLALSAVILVLVFGGVALVISAAPTPAPASPAGPAQPDYLYLTISFNPGTGMDQYFPANFSVPAHTLVVFTITNFDNGTNVPPAAGDIVQGTVGGSASEQIPAGAAPQAYTQLPSTGIAHTFSILQSPYALNVPIPPAVSLDQPIIVTFSAYFNETGVFTWICQAPCDPGSMMTPGLMTGSVTVT